MRKFITKSLLALCISLFIMGSSLMAQRIENKPLKPHEASLTARLFPAFKTVESKNAENNLRTLVPATAFYPQEVRSYFWDFDSTWNHNLTNFHTYNPSFTIALTIDLNSQGDTLGKNIYTYGAQNRMIERVSMFKTTNGWENSDKEAYAYDSEGNTTDELFYQWNNAAWELTYGRKNYYNYNSSNKIIDVVSQDYDMGLLSWVNNWKTEYTYTGANLTMEVQYEWDNSAWVKEEKTNYAYDAQGVPIEAVMQEWDNGAWVNTAKIYNITFHLWNGNIDDSEPLAYTIQVWVGAAWVDMEKVNYTYDAFGGYVSIIQENTLTGWENSSRESEFYDNHYNYIGYEDESWNNNAWTVEYGSKFFNTYNSGGALTESIGQYWDMNLSIYVNSSKEEYFNFLTKTPSIVHAAPVVSIYPNPSEGFVQIELPILAKKTAVQILNAAGQIVYIIDIVNNNGNITQIDLSSLAKGVYFAKIQGDGFSTIKKLVLK